MVAFEIKSKWKFMCIIVHDTNIHTEEDYESTVMLAAL